MQAGIIGLPSSGKTTVFRALTGLAHGADSGPRGRSARGVVKVPDARLDDLARRYRPGKVTHAEIVFTDLPGPGPGSSKSLPPSFVGEMRSMDLLVHVVREFESPGARPDPAADLAALRDEAIIADLEVVEKRLARLDKGEEQGFVGEREVLRSIREALGSGRSTRSMGLAADVLARLSGYALLTEKSEVVVINRDDAAAGRLVDPGLAAAAGAEAAAIIPLCARLEVEIGELDAGEREPFLREMGIDASGTEVFIREVYRALGLVSFFTTVGEELRAWTIRAGTSAVRAAGRIHTDMEKGFIRVDVVAYDDLASLGDEAACRRAGRLRQEGRDYVVEDGDILTVRFNV